MRNDLKKLSICVGTALAALAAPAFAQSFPASKPIRFIVGYAPGGPNDILARIVGQKFTESWGRETIVENRPGGSSNIGAELVAKSAPDGYTLLAATSTALAVNPSLFPKLGFDPQHVQNTPRRPADFHSLVGDPRHVESDLRRSR
jgi:tripartite-type tricarboxylate transporter receptor subunit TctC